MSRARENSVIIEILENSILHGFARRRPYMRTRIRVSVQVQTWHAEPVQPHLDGHVCDVVKVSHACAHDQEKQAPGSAKAGQTLQAKPSSSILLGQAFFLARPPGRTFWAKPGLVKLSRPNPAGRTPWSSLLFGEAFPAYPFWPILSVQIFLV